MLRGFPTGQPFSLIFGSTNKTHDSFFFSVLWWGDEIACYPGACVSTLWGHARHFCEVESVLMHTYMYLAVFSWVTVTFFWSSIPQAVQRYNWCSQNLIAKKRARNWNRGVEKQACSHNAETRCSIKATFLLWGWLFTKKKHEGNQERSPGGLYDTYTLSIFTFNLLYPARGQAKTRKQE